MRVLIVGSGGREHALAWAIARSPSVDKVFATPGNPGMSQVGECLTPPVPGHAGIIALAREVGADLTVIGPEQPLVDGLADELTAAGLTVFGPSGAAARIEGSKSWAADVLAAAGAPTARSATFDSAEAAIAALGDFGPPWVIKADGLAAGKGVAVTRDRAEAEASVRAAIEEARFGESGRTVVLQEHLDGKELSVFFLCDGERAVPVGAARDHKRVGDGDTGPNTGGMGSFTPVPDAGDEVVQRVRTEIAEPVLAEMARRGAPYRGVLYAGLMLTASGPKVFEFNCRFGDPEAEVLSVLFEGDVAQALLDCAEGRATQMQMSKDAAVALVLASGGYPGAIRKGLPITGVEVAAAREGVEVFHAGTAVEDGMLVTAGGRVLIVTARARTLAEARVRAYGAAQDISFEGMHHRRDIAMEGR